MDARNLTKEERLAILDKVAERFPLSAEDQLLLEEDILFVDIDEVPYKVRTHEVHTKPVTIQKDRYYVYGYIPYIFTVYGDWDYELIGILYPRQKRVEVKK